MAVGSFMLVTLNLQAGPMQLIWPRVVQMAGAGLMFAPLAAAAVLYLPKTEMNNASGLFNMLRNEGSSVGIGFHRRASAPASVPLIPLTEEPSALSVATTNCAGDPPGRYLTQVTGDPCRRPDGPARLAFDSRPASLRPGLSRLFLGLHLDCVLDRAVDFPDEAIGGGRGGSSWGVRLRTGSRGFHLHESICGQGRSESEPLATAIAGHHEPFRGEAGQVWGNLLLGIC